MARRKGFFTAETRPEDEQARERELAALVQTKRTIVQDIGVERIQPNPFQARQAFTDLEELAEAIRAHGFTTRLRVRPHPSEPNTFQMVYGERRLRAAKIAGLTSVPCEIADHSDDDMVEIGLAENIQRCDLNPLEEAQAFTTLIEQQGYSIRRLAERIGKDKSYVADRLVLLRMPADVQEMVTQRPDSLRSAREIAKVDQPKTRQPLIKGVIAGSLSTATVREVVRSLTGPLADHAADQQHPVSSTQEQPTFNPQIAMEQDIARDLSKIRAILRRWRQLIEQDGESHAVVAAVIDELTVELKRVARLL